MNIKSEIEYIKTELDKIEDEYLVEAIKNMLAYGKSKKHEESSHPMSIEAFYKRHELSRKSIEENKLISQEQARSYFDRKNVG